MHCSPLYCQGLTGATFQHPVFDGQSTTVQLAVSDRETGKRTHSLHSAGDGMVLGPFV